KYGRRRPAVVSYVCGLEVVQKPSSSNVQSLAQARPGYRADERLSALRFIDEPFTMENGLLTQTYKIKRNQVAAKYADLITAMYS
ncbi:MAG: long-chain fatty acid--CoA ligase, partial [Synechococcaceae cyanobacterium SM2_3_60]|nr:long-chain fatty acid--CoA ligase [Synechococcaceae cyanobacterium SM2_3_60]